MNYEVSMHARNTNFNATDLYLDPEDGGRVVSFCVCGSGTPEPAYHGRWRWLASTRQHLSTDSVVGWLRDHEAELVQLAECYLGAAWTRNNWTGRWSDEAEAIRDRIAADFEEAVAYGSVAHYCDAGDWLAGDPSSAVSQALELGLEAAVEAEVEDAAIQGVLLDEDDVRRELGRLVDAARDDELDDEDGE